MWYDFTVLVILGFAVFRGASKGIVWQLAVIGSLLLCFAFAETFSALVAPYIGIEPPLNRWVSMFLLYVIFSFVAFGAARYLKDLIEKMKFVEYDRHLGGVLGCIKGAVFALFVTFFLVTLSEGARDHVKASYSGYAAAIIMDRLHPVMPAGLHDVLEPIIHQLDRPGMDLRHAHHHDDEHDHDHGDHEHEHDGHDHDSGVQASTAGDEHEHDHDHESHDHDDDTTAEDKRTNKGPLWEIVSTLPGMFDPELQTLAYEALENTSEGDRNTLVEKLSSGVPGLVRAVATEWKHGRPNSTQIDPAERDAMLKEIAGVYSEHPAAQEAIIEEINRSLDNLPASVAFGVIRDWNSDLLALDMDPDPQTELSTPLDARILRQLSLAGVSVSSLPDSLQKRLNDASTQ